MARKKPCGFDDGFQVGRLGLGHPPRVGIAREQQGRDLVDQHVGGLRGQHGRHHELERVAEIQFRVGIGVLLRKSPVDPAGAALEPQERLP